MATPKTAPRTKKSPGPRDPAPPAKGARDRSGALYALVGHEVLQDLDAALAKVNAANDGPQWSRQDLVKRILGRGLKAYLATGTLP